MDLSTLDPTAPANTELARLGAGRIRDVSESVITSFGVEHALTGEHKFLVGDTASRPAPGHAGRLYINTQTGRIERDNGSAWVKAINNPVGFALGSTVLLSGSYASVADGGTNFNAVAAAYLVLGSVVIASIAPSILSGKIQIFHQGNPQLPEYPFFVDASAAPSSPETTVTVHGLVISANASLQNFDILAKGTTNVLAAARLTVVEL